MKINPGRQLNEDESRAYAAGTRAHKSGVSMDAKPWEAWPSHLRKFWFMGWNRCGQRRYVQHPAFASFGSKTLIHGVHLERTEVETLDQALDILEIKRRAKKGAETRRANPRKLSTSDKLRINKALQNTPSKKKKITLAKVRF